VFLIDLALMNDKPATLTASSNIEESYFHKARERSNRLRLIILETDNVKEFMKLVECCSQFDYADKSIAGTLMGTLAIMKFDGSRTMHDHVTEMANIATRLSSMEMKVDGRFLV